MEGADAGDEDHAECGHAGQGRVAAPAPARGCRRTVRWGRHIRPASTSACWGVTVGAGADESARDIPARAASALDGTRRSTLGGDLSEHNSPSDTIAAQHARTAATRCGTAKITGDAEITGDAKGARPEWGPGAGTQREAGQAPPDAEAGRALRPAGELGG